MTEKIIGRIEKKSEGQASTGSKYITYQIEGKSYNTFNAENFDFKVGNVVEMELEQKGKYKNVVSMKSSTEKPTNQNKPISEAKHDVVIQRNEKPHSYEFGKPSARHKICYDSVEELKQHIEALKNSDLVEPDFRDEIN